MKCTILHETRGRMRVRTMQGAMSLRQADILEAYLRQIQGITKATVYDRTGDAVICYDAPRTAIIQALASFSYANEQALAPEHSSRAMSREFEDKLIASLCWRGMKQLFIPSSVRTLITVVRSVPYIKAGLNCLLHKKIQVPVLDAAAISVSMLRKDFETASSIMFLLGIGDILDEWTHKKSVADLAQTMSLNVDKVWKETDAGSVLVPVADVQVGDRIVVRTGGVIPLDGKVVAGEAMVNQASITGGRRLCLCRHRRRRGRLHHLCGKERRQRPLRPHYPHDRGIGKTQVRNGGSRVAPCRPARSVQFGRNSLGLAPDGEYDQSAGCFDGRFFVCAQAIHADRRALCDERGERSSSVR